MAARTNASERVRAEIRRDPYRTARQIAEAAHCSPRLAQVTAQQARLLYGRALTRFERMTLRIPQEDRRWVNAEAERLNVTPEQLLRLIIVDAQAAE